MQNKHDQKVDNIQDQTPNSQSANKQQGDNQTNTQIGQSQQFNPSMKDVIKENFQPQQQQGTTDVIKAKWQQQVGAAKKLWGKLTDDEIMQSNGDADKLAGLVKERYAVDRLEADKQVKKFLAECSC